jgi:ketosteroid isomerase-like protein
MKRSADVEELVKSMWEAMRRGEAASVTGLVADGEDVVWVGTDPDEWWEGADKVRQVIGEQLGAMGGFEVINTNPTAFEDGDVGWVADRGAIRLPDGKEVPIRATGVLTRQAGEWRIVQFHASIGVGNEDALGEDLPT